MGPPEDLIQQFCMVTGAEHGVAVSMLTACNNNLELAIGMHMDQAPAPSTASSTSTSSRPSTSTRAEEAPVRAPIPQVQERLVEDTYQYGFRGRRRAAARSVFDGFRNFEAEMRQQEEARTQDPNEPSSAASRKRKTLEELFRPPLDLMHKGSFNTAKDAGASSNRWLLVNIQNSKEFACQVLNRDVWSNQAVKSIVTEHFVFWQVYHDSEEGRQYMQFYNVTEWPYVAVVDPVTGENMVVWSKLDCNSFCELVTEFLTLHPSLDGSSTASPAKKPRCEEDSIVNASEDAQLQEALRKSVEEAKATAQARTTQPALPEISDDDWLNEDDDLETFSDSDTEDKPMPNTPVKKPATATATASSAAVRESAAPTELSEEFLNNQASVACGDSSKNGESELKPKNGTIPAADTQESCSAVNKTEPGVLTATESTWRTHVGCSQDPESRLQIRFPDGKRDQLNIPCSSKLMAVVQYVNECGFSNERYELVTNYPRRKLSYLDFDDSIKSVGLFPQETIFVQER